MNKYTIPCTPEQTKKALELDAPIRTRFDYDEDNPIPFEKECSIGFREYAHIPTAEEMVGWLEEQGQSIEVSRLYRNKPIWSIFVNDTQIVGKYYPTRKEAILAGIDIVLVYLLTQKQ